MRLKCGVRRRRRVYGGLIVLLVPFVEHRVTVPGPTQEQGRGPDDMEQDHLLDIQTERNDRHVTEQHRSED